MFDVPRWRLLRVMVHDPGLLLICASVVWMVVFVTIFGDGYSEVAKHAQLSYGFPRC